MDHEVEAAREEVRAWCVWTDRLAAVAEEPSTLAPPGCAEWLRMVAESMRQGAGLLPLQ